MVAKLVVHRGDRASACAALASALDATVAMGVRTNQAFLAACLRHPVFVAGRASTAFVPTHGAAVLAGMAALHPAVAALALYASRAMALGHDPCRVALALAWPVPLRFALDGAAVEAGVLALGGNTYRVGVGTGHEDLVLAGCSTGGVTVVSAHGRDFVSWVATAQALYLQQSGRQTVLDDHTLVAATAHDGATAGLLRAPMAGRIVAVPVGAGQTVASGAPLVVLEAMKMEHPACAPAAAVVTRVCVAIGDQVAAGTVLVELEALPPTTELPDPPRTASPP
jgi:geranyl-CoA carboxylase alpha subunit